MEYISNSGIDSIRTIGMSQTKAVGWIGLNCLVLKVNVVSKLLFIFILICIVLLNVMKVKKGAEYTIKAKQNI